MSNFLRSVLTLALLISAASIAHSTARAQQNDTPAEAVPHVGPEVFPVFPWDTLPATKEAYEQAKACGMNLVGFVEAQNLDLVRDAGMRGFVKDASIKIRGTGPDGLEPMEDAEIAKRAKELAARTSQHPATFGYHIIDEPARKIVPRVAEWAKQLTAAAPNVVAYTNFFPIGSSDIGRTGADYEKYLTSYLEAAKPKAFSYDGYSLMDDGTVRSRYFENLEVARRTALKTGIPFWHVALANSHFRYAEPSEATFAFQIYTSLAYGVRGIGWFTYTGRDRGNYHSTAIDLFGHRTRTFDLLRNANLQLHRLAPIYAALKSVGVFHHPVIPQGCVGIDASKFVDDIRGTGPFVVGEFEDAQGRPAILVVNRDMQHSTQVAVVLKAKSAMQRVSSFTGQIRPFGAEDDWLPPGQGILLLLHD